MGKQPRTIVAAVDFSPTSDAAWPAACRLAVDTDSRVHLLHVSPDPLSQAWTVEAIGCLPWPDWARTGSRGPW